MMLLLAFVVGAALGAVRAHRRGGARADMVQYGLAHGFAAAVLLAAGALTLGLFGVSPA